MARVALTVCVLATIAMLVVGQSVAALALVATGIALGAYWWMVLAQRRRPSLTLRSVVIAIAVVLGAAITIVPHESGDIWSYTIYGRMVAVHHASPYRHLPDEYQNDPMFGYVTPTWRHTGSVYGPAFNALSAGVAPVIGDSAVRARLVYQILAAASVVGALVLVWRRTRSVAALAWLGLHPLIGVYVVNSGRNDALIGLAILGAALLMERGKSGAAGFLSGVGAAIKATGLLAGAGLGIWTWRRRRYRQAVTLAATTAVVVVGAYAAAGGAVALGPLEHASAQISRGSIWGLPPRLGLPSVSTTIAMVVTTAVVAVCLYRQTDDDAAQAAIAGPAAFLLATPYALPGYLAWVLPTAALRPERAPARIIALQGTVLVGAYAVFRHSPSGPIGTVLTRSSALLAATIGIFLLVSYIRAGTTPRDDAERTHRGSVPDPAPAPARRAASGDGSRTTDV
jgi:hypothetical protein